MATSTFWEEATGGDCTACDECLGGEMAGIALPLDASYRNIKSTQKQYPQMKMARMIRISLQLQKERSGTCPELYWVQSKSIPEHSKQNHRNTLFEEDNGIIVD